ncbi:Pc12g11150 [Penicillium rubens Wisconsin 54-1255]|uniref:Pc12g11150 protein n=1 Tax=Penicillium rubens (strain ATCC 28089 / DSM 1075 / NRRL 1951 / Wisconsin 54-1255) TaxID=500485 RepID=B6GX37_PENRW|nr:Pc12g11150 [Penicillium rubens Wisconsin 54-1255]
MSCPADSERSPTGPTREEYDNHSLVPEEDLVSEWKGREENKTAETEKVACDRCRQRKCIKTGSQCTYQLGLKAKEKRQRILISNVYENRMEHISNKIDKLSEMMRQLSHERTSNSGFAGSAGLRSPSHSFLQSTESQLTSSDKKAGAKRPHLPLKEAEGIDSTLFSHVIFATRYLQDVVENDPYSHVAAEMTSALDGLRSTVNAQNQQNETLEGSPPFSKALPPGLGFRELPIPSMDRILACLRIAYGSYALFVLQTATIFTNSSEERSPNEVYWPFEFGSLGDFTGYVVKACSPGPVTDTELIIVHYGLYCLFTECSRVVEDGIVKQEYEAQATICKDSLETILSNLSFHIPTNIDSVCAMYMAAVYCLQCGKPFAAWTFISRASLMSQALGMHSSHVVATQPAEKVQRKLRLFWALYVIEKVVSLRLGRCSTIRDHEITVPRLLLDRKMSSLLYNRLPDWIDVANLYGRVYDNIYGPNALAQPVSVRESRARALAAELERIMAARVEFHWTSHAIHAEPCRFIIHANRAIEYSILACIYRGIPSGESSSLAPCPECISAARATLKETEVCITMVSDATSWSPSLDIWVNEVVILAPFMPFLILFCNIIETSDSSDLAYLHRLVDGLHSMAQSPRYSSCSKQLRILKALYDVAAKYVEAKARSQPGDMDSGQVTDLDMNTYLNSNTVWFDSDSHSPSLSTAPDSWSLDGTQKPVPAPAGTTEAQQAMNQASGFQTRGNSFAMHQQISDDFITGVDTPGVQLGSWFHQSHQMMGLLDDF